MSVNPTPDEDRAGSGTTRVNGQSVQRQILRTGSRVELGAWTFACWRAECADHGRPFGGRIGGEAGHQRPQPGRCRRAEPGAEADR